MYDIAKQTDDDLRQTFLLTSSLLGIQAPIVEKDFWVSLLLDYLFTKSEYKEMFILKGGTSLSKGYGYINRFSEDIDLVIKYTYFDSKMDEILSPASSTNHRVRLCERLDSISAEFVQNKLLVDIKDNLGKLINREIDITIDPDDPMALRFNYPRFFNGKYILDYILIECGSLSSLGPTENVLIHPLVYELNSNLYPKEKYTPIVVFSPIRTYWEKINAIHTCFVKPLSKSMETSFSRHLFDIYCLGKTDIKENAFNDLELQLETVNISDAFYHYGWLDLAPMKSHQYVLVPPESRYEKVKEDYELMQDLIWGDEPSFEELIDYLKDLQEEIKNL